jgi:CheY-like chemotaxis protein
MRILIAEDDIVSKMVLVRMIRHLGHDVIETSDGIELKEKFMQNVNNIDCIISDVMMPNCSGIEAIRDINKIKKIPSIIVTAVEQNAVMADKNGVRLSWTVCDLYLAKPITLKNLENVLHNIQKII